MERELRCRTRRIVLGEPHVDRVRLPQHVVGRAHDLLVHACDSGQIPLTTYDALGSTHCHLH